jgi:hypothetical protein
MNIDSIVSIISSVGFPIFACIVMFKQNEELQKTLSDISNTMTLLTERIKDVENKLNIDEEVKNDN